MKILALIQNCDIKISFTHSSQKQIFFPVQPIEFTLFCTNWLCDASGRRKKNCIQPRSRNESLNASNRFLIQHPNERILSQCEFLFFILLLPHFSRIMNFYEFFNPKCLVFDFVFPQLDGLEWIVDAIFQIFYSIAPSHSLVFFSSN